MLLIVNVKLIFENSYELESLNHSWTGLSTYSVILSLMWVSLNCRLAQTKVRATKKLPLRPILNSCFARTQKA